MGNVRRVYVEKKPDFAVKAKELKHEVKYFPLSSYRDSSIREPIPQSSV